MQETTAALTWFRGDEAFPRSSWRFADHATTPANTLQLSGGALTWQSQVTRTPKATRRRSPLLRKGFAAVLGLYGIAQNSLRALRALRSNNRAKSDDDGACAPAAMPCAPRLRRRGQGKHQSRLAAHRRDGASLRSHAMRSEPKQSSRSEQAYCSWAPWVVSRSAGFCSGRVSAFVV